jgi:hypothetical protein
MLNKVKAGIREHVVTEMTLKGTARHRTSATPTKESWRLNLTAEKKSGISGSLREHSA